MQVKLFESEKITPPAPGAPHDHLWYNRPYLGISHIWACPITAVTLAKMFVINSRPRHFLQLLANTLFTLRAGHLTPFNKSHLGISHIWACPLIAVFLANTYYRNQPRP